MEADIKELLHKLILSLVDEKDKVDISCTITKHTAVYDIKVASKDVGKVLGKKGVYADALRTLFGAIYGRNGKKLHLQVLDPSKKKPLKVKK